MTTLPSAWLTGWANRPGAPALVGPEGQRVAAGELEERSAALARRLAGSGVVAGDRVVVSAATSLDVVEVHVALLRLGAVVVPVNPAATTRELDHVLGSVGPVAAVTDDPSRFAHRALLVTTPDIPLLATDDVPLDASPPGAAAFIGFTSGTTGQPKGAVHTHASLLAGAQALVTTWEWAPEDRLVHALPLFHVHGLVVALYGTLLAGASCVLLDRFEAAAVLDASAEHEATLFFGVPTMYARLLRSPRVGELARLRLAVSGSAPLSPDLFHAAAAALGQPLLERYGMTETVMLTSNPLHGERRPGSVGLPLPGVELRLAPSGEVEARGPSVFAGYWGRDDASRESMTADGWFRTGDVGQWDPAGYLQLVGRRSELIISGGFNVYPREVEDVLRQVPGVADVAVAGEADDEWGEVVCAYVVGDATRSHLDQASAAALSPYKRPRRWRFVGALPRNAMGKVQRDRLGDA